VHVDPVTASLRETAQGGGHSTRTEFDPLGNDAPLTDPAPPDDASPDYLYPGAYSDGGNTYDGSSGCTVDGQPIDCSFAARLVSADAAGVCPDNRCGVRWNFDRGEWVNPVLTAEGWGNALGGGWTMAWGVVNAQTGRSVEKWRRQGRRRGQRRDSGQRPQQSPQPQNPASLAPNGSASNRKLSDEECDKKLSEIFGGKAYAMVNSDIRGRGRGDDGHTAIPRNDRPTYWYSGGERYRYDRGGIIHTYTDGNGSARTDVGLNAPSSWLGTPVSYYDKAEGNSGLRFTYATGLTISFVHVGTSNPNRVPSIPTRSSEATTRIGYVGGFGGEGDGYYHTHIIFSAGGLRVDPRKVFCGF